MAKRQEFSFLAYCATSGLCGALSATCGKEAGNLAASPYIATAMYSAMLAVRAPPIIISLFSPRYCIYFKSHATKSFFVCNSSIF